MDGAHDLIEQHESQCSSDVDSISVSPISVDAHNLIEQHETQCSLYVDSISVPPISDDANNLIEQHETQCSSDVDSISVSQISDDPHNLIEQHETQCTSDVDSISVLPISGDRDRHYSLSQLIDEDGKFNMVEAEEFIKNEPKLNEAAPSPAVVSIIGPQISGKSTLLNHLFGTNFKEMDAHALKGRSATTKGLWMAKSADTPHIVLDLEGTDGSRRPQGDTAFEKRLALLAIHVSDIVIVNMWSYDDFGEENATKSLLRTLFAACMRLSDPRETTLMFVIRDHEETQTPLEDLQDQITKDVKTILMRYRHKPTAGKGTPIKIPKVKVVVLPSYRYNREEFQKEVGNLRKQLISVHRSISYEGTDDHSIQDWLLRVQHQWKDMNQWTYDNKEANSLSRKVVDEEFNGFLQDRAPHFRSKLTPENKNIMQPSAALNLGKEIKNAIEASLLEFDLETSFINEAVCRKGRKELENKLLEKVQSFFQDLLEVIYTSISKEYKRAFEKQKNYSKGTAAASHCIDYHLRTFDSNSRELVDAIGESPDFETYVSNKREELERGLKEHEEQAVDKHAKHIAKLEELTELLKKQMALSLTKEVQALVDDAGNNTWSKIRKLIDDNASSFVVRLSKELGTVDEQTKDNKYKEFKNYGRGEVERIIRQGADVGTVLLRLENRFLKLMLLEPQKRNVEEMGRNAYLKASEFLSFMETIRLDENTGHAVDEAGSAKDEPVPSSKNLINPREYADLRRQFREYATSIIETKTRMVAQDSHESTWNKIWRGGR